MLARRIVVTAQKVFVNNAKPFSAAINVKKSSSTFPNEREGNVYDVNFSLLADGITSVGDSFRNARNNLLATRLGVKESNGAFVVQAPALDGAGKVVEAGDNISQDAFTNLKAAQEKVLSSGADLFVEDAGLGALFSSRTGTRIVTQSAATALFFRKLLIPISESGFDFRARFDGWENDERWRTNTPVWNGSKFDVRDRPASTRGQRPIAAFIGGEGETVAVQFVERNGGIVGADVVAGTSASVRSVIDGLTLASTVVANALYKDKIAVPSAVFSTAQGTLVLVGASDAIVDGVAKTAKLYGAYSNILSADGVSAMWNGVIANASDAKQSATAWSSDVPSVVVNNKTVTALEPDNLVGPATHVVFYKEGSSKGVVSAEDAVKRIVELTDESKKDVATSVLKGSKVFTAGSQADVLSVLA